MVRDLVSSLCADFGSVHLPDTGVASWARTPVLGLSVERSRELGLRMSLLPVLGHRVPGLQCRPQEEENTVEGSAQV